MQTCRCVYALYSVKRNDISVVIRKLWSIKFEQGETSRTPQAAAVSYLIQNSLFCLLIRWGKVDSHFHSWRTLIMNAWCCSYAFLTKRVGPRHSVSTHTNTKICACIRNVMKIRPDACQWTPAFLPYNTHKQVLTVWQNLNTDSLVSEGKQKNYKSKRDSVIL